MSTELLQGSAGVSPGAVMPGTGDTPALPSERPRATAPFLYDLPDDPEFKKLPDEDKSTVLDTAIADVHAQASAEPDYDYQKFGQFADKIRERAAPGRLTKLAKDVGAGLLNMGKDMASIPGSAVPFVMHPVEVTKTAADAMLTNTADWIRTPVDFAERHLGSNAKALHSAKDGVIDEIKTGRLPFDDPIKLLEWLKQKDAEIYPLQVKHQGERIAQKSRMATPAAAALVADYIHTRNPAALEELERGLTATQSQVRLAEHRARTAQSKGAQAFEAVYGKDSAHHLTAGYDPLNFVFAGRAAKAAQGTSAMVKGAKVGAEMAGYGVAGAIRANPDASLKDMGEESLKMILMGGLIHGAGYAVRRLTKNQTTKNQGTETSASESASQSGVMTRPGDATPVHGVTSPHTAPGSSPGAGSEVSASLSQSSTSSKAAKVESGPIADAFRAADELFGDAGAGLNTHFPLNGRTGGFLNADLINHGVDLIARGVRDFGRWSAEMLRKFGEAIRAYLRDLWEVVVPAEVRGAGPHARGSGLGATGVSDKEGADGGSGGGGAPRVAHTDAWETPRFSQRVQAAETLKGAWHAAFEPQAYEKRTVEGWHEFEQNASRWVEQHGPEAAADLVLDRTTDMAGDERVILAGVAMRAADSRAAAGDPVMNDLSAAMADFLGTQGSKAGQTVRAYGYLVERDPTLTLADFERQHTETTEKDVETKLKTGARDVAEKVKRTAGDEKERAVKETEAKMPGIVRTAKGIIDRLAREFSDTPTDVKARVRSALQNLHSLVQRGMRELIPDFAAQAEALGVTPAEASQLARLVETGRARSAAVARERAGQKLIAAMGPTVSRAARSKLPRLIEALLKAWETGVLGRTEFLDAYAKTFDLPTFTPEIRARLQELVRAVREAPDGTPKAEAMRALQDELGIFSGVKAGDALLSAWYANLLSGLSTQGINIWGNLTNLLLRTPAAILANHPADSLNLLAGHLRGARKGWEEFKRVLGGGVQHKAGEKYADSGPLERIYRQGGPRTIGQHLARAFSLGPVGRYVFRGLSGMDAFFYYTAAEGRAQLAASRAVRARGLKPGTPEFTRAVAEDLGLGSDRWQAALDQATAEARSGGFPKRTGPLGRLPSAASINARALEIVEAERSAELRHESHRYGDLMTYNYEPEGNAGKVYQAITGLQGVNIHGVPIVRPFLPFARMVANLTASNLDFTPIGAWRGLKGGQLGAAKDAPMAAWEARERLTASVIGAAVAAVVYSWAKSNKDENDTDTGFMIYGMGPHNRDLMPKGWKPYTMKIGKTYVSYAETPLVFMLAPIGAMMDAERYTSSWKDRDGMAKALYLGQLSMGAVTSQGVLSSMANFLEMLSGKRKPQSLVSSFTSGMVPAQGLLRDINTLFDGRKIDADTVGAAIFRDVPVIRGMMGRPALNVWGEPVKFEGLERIPVVKRVLTGGGTPDPASDWLSRNKLNIPALPQNLAAGQYLPHEDKAGRMNRIHAMVWTDAERYEFAQKSGQKLKTLITNSLKVDQGREAPPTQKMLQKRVDAFVDTTRAAVMREMIDRVR